MKKLAVILSVSFLLSSVFTLKAADNMAEINLDVTLIDYVKFTGTVIDSVKYFDVDDLAPLTSGSIGPSVSIGTLGIESNSVGLCDISVSTVNSFRLRHITSNKRLAGYRLWYLGQRINRNNPEMTVSCNEAPSDIEIQVWSNYLDDLESGIYTDTITLTITTQ